MNAAARFDDLRPGRRRSFSLEGHAGSVSASGPDGAVAALDELEDAVAGGLWAAGFVSYEAAPGLDPAMTVRSGEASPPPVWFDLYERREPAIPIDRAGAGYQLGKWNDEMDRADYEKSVEQVRSHIRAGDTYQVNFSTRLNADFEGDPLGYYRDLAMAQSGGYGAFLTTGREHIASASPELFFEWRRDVLTTRPMKGTTRRGRWLEEDEELRMALLASEKDRAENVMIVDLLRSDLGRVSRTGSVRVDDLFAAERFDTVWQLTSTVTSVVRAGTRLSDVFKALFPCGSVTGAPKVRTMEIIADLERSPRGVYCGAIGFLAPPGVPGPKAAFNVAIRTVHINNGQALYGVGGGITWGSSAAGEFEESQVKAELLSRARAPFDLLETLRWDPVDGWWWLEEHLRRLGDSAGYFGIDLDEAEVRSALEHHAVGDSPRRVRLTVARDGRVDARGDPAPEANQPVTVALDHVPIDRADALIYHKTTRRSVYEEALARHPGVDEVLLVNDRGEVTESTQANVVVLLDGRWVTPPISSGCLPGVHRAAVLADQSVIEAPIGVVELESAEEIALINSVRGWMPVVLRRQPRFPLPVGEGD